MSFNQLEENWFLSFDQTYLPIIYRSEVNIGFLGIEELHTFDSKKFGKIATALSNGCMKNKNFIKAKKATMEQIYSIHSKKYIEKLNDSKYVSEILMLQLLENVPNFMLWYIILNPLLYHVGATILGGEIALKSKWSICLSGGMVF